MVAFWGDMIGPATSTWQEVYDQPDVECRNEVVECPVCKGSCWDICCGEAYKLPCIFCNCEGRDLAKNFKCKIARINEARRADYEIKSGVRVALGES